MSFLQAVTTQQTFTIGTDGNFTLVLGTQQIGPFGLNDEYTHTTLEKEEEKIPQNTQGRPVRRITYEGDQFEFHITRTSPIFDNLRNALQKSYYSGGSPVTLSGYETIREVDGTSSQWIYTGGTLKSEGRGRFRSAESVDEVRFTIKFTDCQEAGGLPNPFDALMPAGANT